MATIINTIEQLHAIRNNISGDYELGRNLDFNDDGSYTNPANKSTYTTGAGWSPIGTWSNNFVGIFDGKGFTISNLYINRSNESGEDHGFFGVVGTGGLIQNFKIINANIRGFYTGVIAGSLLGCTARNIHVQGVVLYHDEYSGGFAGYCSNSLVEKCSANVGISPNNVTENSIGVLIGQGEGGTIIRQCKADGSFYGDSHVAGIVGLANGNCTVEDCYNEAINTNGNFGVAGIVGASFSSGNIIRRCFNTGVIGASGAGVGNILGHQYTAPTQANNFFVSSLSTKTQGIIGTDLTQAQAKTLASFTGWDIVLIANYSNQVWYIDQNVDFPRLGWEYVAVPSDINASVELTNIPQTIEATASAVSIRQVEVNLTNAFQTIESTLKPIITSLVELTNGEQTMLTEGGVQVSCQSILENSQQLFESTFSQLDVRSAAIELENGQQTIESNVRPLINTEVEFTNPPQLIESSVQVGVEVDASFVNSQQIVEVSVVLHISGSVDLTNAPQSIEATIAGFPFIEVALTNSPQQIEIQGEVVVGVVGELTNASQAIESEGKVIVVIEAGLFNAPQTIDISTSERMDVVVELINSPQTIQTEGSVLLNAQADFGNSPQLMEITVFHKMDVAVIMQNNPQVFSASVFGEEITHIIYIGDKRVTAIYLGEQYINQIHFGQ